MAERSVDADLEDTRAALSALYEAAVQVVDVTNPDIKQARRHLSSLLDRYESRDYDWRKAVHAWIDRAEAAEARVSELEAAIRAHRDRMNKHYELMPGPDDRELYAALEGDR